MGRRGPVPEPTASKLARGVRADRINHLEPVPPPLAEVPQPPEHLDAVARGIWSEVAPVLYRTGILTTLDLPMLSSFCTAMGVARQAAALLSAGILSPGRRDRFVTNPAFRAYRDATMLALSLAREFGLTPSSRSAIVIRVDVGRHGLLDP